MKNKTFLINRTDSIGDVILTLPMAGALKFLFPDCKIIFLGQSYTKAVIDVCEHIDTFLNWSEIQHIGRNEQIKLLKSLQIDEFIHVFPKKEIAKIAKQSGIKTRTGTKNRWYHWLYCNNKITLSRRNSELHEAQLNLILIKHLTNKNFSISEIQDLYGFTRISDLSIHLKEYISTDKKNIILHPKSKGSAREWGLSNFATLIEELPKDKYHIFLTGTEKEGELFRDSLVKPFPHITDLSGKMTLEEMIAFIAHCDIFVACSTGPLHIASALGKKAIGLYPPIKPMHPGRWAPIGKNAITLVNDKDCEQCRKTGDCECIRAITPESVAKYIMN